MLRAHATGGACPAHTRGLPCFRKFNRGRHVKLYGFLVAVASVRGWHVNLILPRLVQLFEIYLPMRTPAAVRSSRVPRLSRLMRGTNPGEALNLGTPYRGKFIAGTTDSCSTRQDLGRG